MEKPTKKVVQSWRNFLDTLEGQAGLLYLKSHTPIPYPESPEKMIFQAGMVNGFNAFTSTLESFLLDDPKPSQESMDTLDSSD